MADAGSGKRVALVTGASSGIGAVTAARLAQDGMRVALTARRASELEDLAAAVRRGGGETLVVPADLASAAERSELVEKVAAEWGQVDVLVNNAGFAVYTDVADTPLNVVEELFQVNVIAAIHLVQLTLPEMLARDWGRVVNIASLSGYVAAPPLTAYAATKHALVGFSEGLQRELRRHRGVGVTIVAPGPVRTDFGRRASGLPVDPGKVPGGLPPEAVARAVARAVRRPRRQIVLPAWYGPGMRITRVLPFVTDARAARQETLWRRHLAEVGDPQTG